MIEGEALEVPNEYAIWTDIAGEANCGRVFDLASDANRVSHSTSISRLSTVEDHVDEVTRLLINIR